MEPVLIENGFKYYLNESLKNCRIAKQRYMNNMYNIGLFVFLIVGVFLVLFFKFKGKLTEKEREEKEKVKQQYILSRIKNYQDVKRRSSQALITGLPHWSNEYDDIYKKYNGII